MPSLRRRTHPAPPPPSLHAPTTQAAAEPRTSSFGLPLRYPPEMVLPSTLWAQTPRDGAPGCASERGAGANARMGARSARTAALKHRHKRTCAGAPSSPGKQQQLVSPGKQHRPGSPAKPTPLQVSWPALPEGLLDGESSGGSAQRGGSPASDSSAGSGDFTIKAAASPQRRPALGFELLAGLGDSLGGGGVCSEDEDGVTSMGEAPAAWAPSLCPAAAALAVDKEGAEDIVALHSVGVDVSPLAGDAPYLGLGARADEGGEEEEEAMEDASEQFFSAQLSRATSVALSGYQTASGASRWAHGSGWGVQSGLLAWPQASHAPSLSRTAWSLCSPTGSTGSGVRARLEQTAQQLCAVAAPVVGSEEEEVQGGVVGGAAAVSATQDDAATPARAATVRSADLGRSPFHGASPLAGGGTPGLGQLLVQPEELPRPHLLLQEAQAHLMNAWRLLPPEGPGAWLWLCGGPLGGGPHEACTSPPFGERREGQLHPLPYPMPRCHEC